MTVRVAHWGVSMPAYRFTAPTTETGLRRLFYLVAMVLCTVASALPALLNPDFHWFTGFYETLVPVVLVALVALTALLWVCPARLRFVERALFGVAVSYNLALFVQILYLGPGLELQGYLDAYRTFSPFVYVWAFLAFGRHRGLANSLLFMGGVLTLAAPYLLALTPARADSYDVGLLILNIPTVGGVYLIMLYALTYFLERSTQAHTAAAAEARLAYVDPLTGLPNRLLFDQRLTQAVQAARAENRSFALAFIDLDRFKDVNDALGHRAGDLLLCAVAARLQGQLRSSDLLARISGDEFAVLLPCTASPAAVRAVAQKLLEGLEPQFDLEGTSYRASASMGFSLYSSDANTPDTLLAQADKAMYLAKRRGRNGYYLQPTTPGEPAEVAGACLA